MNLNHARSVHDQANYIAEQLTKQVLSPCYINNLPCIANHDGERERESSITDILTADG